jgi:hypothetical protein
MEALAACFKQTVLYQPSGDRIPPEIQAWAESNTLDIRIPVSGHEDTLEAILKDYADWMNLHQEGAMEYFKARRGSIPFFDETFASQIRAEIKAKTSPSRLQEGFEDLLNARLFLHIAQDFDLQNNKLSQDLVSFEAMEQNLFDNLKGEDETSPPKTTARDRGQMDDPGLYMPGERLKSWTLVRQNDREASGLYITTSRSVFDELIDCAPEAEMVIGFDAVPVYEKRNEKIARWQDDLVDKLNLLLTHSWPPPSDVSFEVPAVKGYNRTVAMKLHIAAGETPHQFFARCVAGGLLPAPDEQKEGIIKNTLIGIIEF